MTMNCGCSGKPARMARVLCLVVRGPGEVALRARNRRIRTQTGASSPGRPFTIDEAGFGVQGFPLAGPTPQRERVGTQLLVSIGLMASQFRDPSDYRGRKRNRLPAMDTQDTAVMLLRICDHSEPR